MLWPVWSMDVNGTVCCAAYRSPNTELWSQPVGGFLGGFELAREHGSFNYIYSTMKYCIRCRNFSRSMITTWKEAKSGKVQIPKWKSGFQVSNILSSNPSNGYGYMRQNSRAKGHSQFCSETMHGYHPISWVPKWSKRWPIAHTQSATKLT